MRLFVCMPLLLAACSACGDDLTPKSPLQVIGKLENPKLSEASGLAGSRRDPNLFWVINDDGPAAVHGIDHSGRKLARIKINGAKSVDWEDLASFTHNGIDYLAVADIGDNESKREHVSLYVIAEPDFETKTVDIEWRVDFSYPEGPRDAESLAVDADGEHFYVLSKREIPAVLYSIPLRPDNDDLVVAERQATIDSLPQPSAAEKKDAKGSGWAWQPTAMDFSVDGRKALILTYKGVYLFSREEQQSWTSALNNQALEFKLGKIKGAESISFGEAGETAILTIEKKHAPLYQLNLPSDAE